MTPKAFALSSESEASSIIFADATPTDPAMTPLKAPTVAIPLPKVFKLPEALCPTDPILSNCLIALL